MIIQSENFIQNPLVSVVIITYNQEQYITQCIESILAQKTDFPFEIIIGEDFGTDSTRDICKEYQKKFPEKIKLILNDKNTGVVENWINCIIESKGKYIAQCAGDDYWHNINKIQIQTEFLEENPNYGIVHSDFDEIIVNKNISVNNYYNKNNVKIASGNVFKELFYNYHIHTLTACFRKELFLDFVPFQKIINLGFTAEDRVSYTIMSKYTLVYYMEISTATYRRIDGSISSPNNFSKGESYYYLWYKQSEFIAQLFPNEILFDERNERIYKNNAILSVAFKSNLFQQAKKYALLLNKDGIRNKKIFFAKNILLFKLFIFFRKFKNLLLKLTTA